MGSGSSLRGERPGRRARLRSLEAASDAQWAEMQALQEENRRLRERVALQSLALDVQNDSIDLLNSEVGELSKRLRFCEELLCVPAEGAE